MEDHQSILRKVGWALIAIGCLDIAFMIYCIMNGFSYSSSFNVFSVVAGVFLLRGSLRAARVIASFLAFLLAAFGTLLVVFPLVQPLDLWFAKLRSDTSSAAFSLGISLVFLLLLVWAYRQLRSPPVLAASLVACQKTSTPKGATVLGILLVIVLAVAMQLMARSHSGAKAVQLAQEQVGTGYRFHVEGMRWSGDHVSADIAAYNDREVKTIHVQWQQ